MYCDYDALAEYALKLNKDFNNIIMILNDIESSFNTISSISNWDSKTRDYYSNMAKSFTDNFDLINNKFNNVNLYIDSIISNYRATDQGMSSLFGG